MQQISNVVVKISTDQADFIKLCSYHIHFQQNLNIASIHSQMCTLELLLALQPSVILKEKSMACCDHNIIVISLTFDITAITCYSL